jgi:AcrR family transcriptional regulator
MPVVRQERAVRSQAAVLDAAIVLLTNEGYSALSTRAVQQTSGLSRGAFLHHFPTREDLLAATVEELVARRAVRAQVLIDAFASDPPPDRLTAAITTVRSLLSGPDFLAEMELWGAARTYPALMEALRPVLARVQTKLRAQLAELFGPEITAHPDYPAVSALTRELSIGLAVTGPLRGGRGDARLLDHWCRAATSLLGAPAPA